MIKNYFLKKYIIYFINLYYGNNMDIMLIIFLVNVNI